MKKPLSKKAKIALISVASVILLIGLGLLSFVFYILDFNAHPKATFDISYAKVTDDITVMNFNVRCISPEDLGEKTWFERAPRVIAQIAENEPDIICFQEVTHVHQGFLKNALKGYGYTIKYRGVGALSEATPIYYNLKKFELVSDGGFWLSPTPNKMSKGWGAAMKRVCSYVVLRQKSDGKEFAVFNTHLDHVSELARVNGIKLVLDKIKELGDLPSMLLGDMNALYGSDTYNAAIESFDDSREVAKTTEENRNTFHNYGKKSGDSAIDYCFLLKDKFDVDFYHVLAEKVNGEFASDHYALKIILKLK